LKLKIRNYNCMRGQARLHRYAKHCGQVAVFVLLISAIIMTVGMSVAKRTVVETKIDTDEELLKQAFNAAESGIDNYLLNEETNYQSGSNDMISAEVELENVGGENTITFEETILENKNAFLWLRDRDENDELNYGSGYSGNEVEVCLTNTSGGNFEGSLKIDYFYQDAGGVIQVARVGYNLSGSDGVMGYDDIESNCVDYTLTETPLLLSLTPIFASARMSVSGTSSFPIQGEKIISTGMAGDVESVPVLRRVSVVNQHQIPRFMIEAITAKGDVSN